MSRLRVSFVLLVVTFAIGDICCNIEEKNAKYSKVEIYCKCFLYDSINKAKDSLYPGVFGECETFDAFRPSFLATAKYFFDSTTNSVVINNLRKTIFDSKKSSENTDESYPDSRLLILFRKNDTESDTVVFKFPNTIYLNNKTLFKYSFNVLDSVRRILGKDRIDCRDN